MTTFYDNCQAALPRAWGCLTPAINKVVLKPLLTPASCLSLCHADAWEPHLTRVEVHLCEAEGSEPPTTTP